MLHPRFLVCLCACAAFAQSSKHPFGLDDLARFREVRDPQCSPDGKWVAYVVGTTDAKEDKHDSDIWMVSLDGKQDLRITSSPESETSPRWSPDGKYLAFLSSRPGKAKGNQVWLLDRNGGEAQQLTDVKGRLQGYEWSPDSKRLALVMGDPDPEGDAADSPGGRGGAAKAPKPIVIDRYHFKQDGAGYLLSDRHTYIYLFDIAAKKSERLTSSKWDESAPVWSPDGAHIAFVSNHHAEPDRDIESQIYVADAHSSATERALTPMDLNVSRGRPEWSSDGSRIAFLVGDEKKFGAYGMERLYVVPASGGAPAIVQAAADLDRGVSQPHWSADGQSIHFLVADDQSVYPARVAMSNRRTPVEKLMKPPLMVSAPTAAGSCSALLSSSDLQPSEIFAFENGALRQLTHQNAEVMASLETAPTQEVRFKSKDGTEIDGLLTLPLNYTAGTRVPLLLRIHGGPNGQDAHSYTPERQFFAAHGYAVLNVNYRGSSGRGQKFSRAIFADWGHLEVEDLAAGVNEVIRMGIADPNRLGVGGWSYGGILTDYMIASDTRFKAATSGAGTAFTVSFYGTDQYIIQYDYEIGPPWKNFDTYVKISYPFLHADRIKTPTLFLGGERDFNVPVQGGQQMYQALRSLGIDTQLIIYPNETHGIQRPSYQRDRMERYLGWYDRYLKPHPAAAAAPAGNK